MKLKRQLAFLLAFAIAFSALWSEPIAAAGGFGLFPWEPGIPGPMPDAPDWDLGDAEEDPDVTDEDPGADGENPDVTDEDPGMDGEDPDVTDEDPASPPEPVKNFPFVEGLTVSCNGEGDLVLEYTVKNDWDYVDILVNRLPEEEEYHYESYVFRDWEEGKEYLFEVVPYRNGKKGESQEISYSVPYKDARIKELFVEYDLERQVLYVDWDGEGVHSVKVYLDHQMESPIAGTYVEAEEGWVSSIKLLPKSVHDLTVVPYNKGEAEGKAAEYKLAVGDYEARIETYSVEYVEATKRIEMNWESSYTSYVSIYLNDEELIEHYKGSSFVYRCVLQPGASYVVTILPFNGNDEEGEESEEDISFGGFDVPDRVKGSVTNIDLKDASGNYTGFTRPAVSLQWDAQEQAVYEIYRAGKDRKGSYNWIATVRAGKTGKYTYVDEKIGFENYYYKVRRKIAVDRFLYQELYTALSDARHIKVEVPKPKVKVKLGENGKIQLALSADRQYVAGYEIYRKSGKGAYQLLASVTENKFTDKDVLYGQSYNYKVKAYYYDAGTGTKTYGKFSSASSVKNTIGAIRAEAVATSADTVRLSWVPAANADLYEVYGRSNTLGDSYVLLTTTTKTSLTHKVEQGDKYFFLIKAYQKKDQGSTYFSSKEVSVRMGFSAPGGVGVKGTSYKYNQKKKELTQKDKITWNRVYGAKGYCIERYDATSKKYRRVAKVKSGGKTSYTVSNLVTAASKTLKYRVSAYAGKKTLNGQTVEVTPQLGTVLNVSVKKSGTKVKISWKKVTGAESYRVYRSNGRTMLLVGETAKAEATDIGLSAGVPYSYYVQAVSQTAKLVGNFSAAVSYTASQAKVSNLTASNTVGGTVQLAWGAAKDAQKYLVYCKTSPKGEYQKIAEVSAKETAYTHDSQALGQTCGYMVTAARYNSGGILTESKPMKVSLLVL